MDFIIAVSIGMYVQCVSLTTKHPDVYTEIRGENTYIYIYINVFVVSQFCLYCPCVMRDNCHLTHSAVA